MLDVLMVGRGDITSGLIPKPKSRVVHSEIGQGVTSDTNPLGDSNAVQKGGTSRVPMTTKVTPTGKSQIARTIRMKTNPITSVSLKSKPASEGITACELTNASGRDPPRDVPSSPSMHP